MDTVALCLPLCCILLDFKAHTVPLLGVGLQLARPQYCSRKERVVLYKYLEESTLTEGGTTH